MKIAIFGSTSNIASDVISHLIEKDNLKIDLYSRNDGSLLKIHFNKNQDAKIRCMQYTNFDKEKSYDVIINFIGLGCPMKIKASEDDLVAVAEQYDSMILDYISNRYQCKYIYISSGAVYGENFLEPVPSSGKAIQELSSKDNISNYATSKIVCENMHRLMPNYAIVDLRVFSYFSAEYDSKAHFFMSEICNAIRNHKTLNVTPDRMVRDYIHPSDFCQIIDRIIESPAINTVVDCYSKAPIEKIDLLKLLRDRYRLSFHMANSDNRQSIYTNKSNYYSLMKEAQNFGYQPNYSSAEGIILECDKLFRSENIV